MAPAPDPWCHRKPDASALPPAPPASSFLFSRLDGVSHRRLSGSKSTSAERRSPRLPTRNTRRRRCGTPANCASRTDHARPYPSSSMLLSRHPKSSPCELESAPGTFSQTNHRGRTSRTHRTYSHMRPLAPSSPVRFPAMLKDWQGLPPTTRSAAPYSRTTLFQLTIVMSPRFGTSGHLSLSTALGNSSTSQKQAGSHPSGSQASVAASTPENTL